MSATTPLMCWTRMSFRAALLGCALPGLALAAQNAPGHRVQEHRVQEYRVHIGDLIEIAVAVCSARSASPA